MSLICILVAMIAFALFGLSTDGHHRKHLSAPITPGHRRNMRIGAWIGVALCFTLAFAAKGPVYGAIFWLGALCFGAAATFLTLNLAPARRIK